MKKENTDGSDGAIDENSGNPRNWFPYLLIPIAFVIIAGILAWQLLTGSPDKIPSALIDKPVPQFALPPIPGLEQGLTNKDIEDGGISLVNVFASWCGPCRIEHPLLMEIAKEGSVPIWGLNYKDRKDDSRKWLSEFGNPYKQIGWDITGRVGINWGVYGVPETFVIDDGGRIIYKHIGLLSPKDWKEKIVPLINTLSN